MQACARHCEQYSCSAFVLLQALLLYHRLIYCSYVFFRLTDGQDTFHQTTFHHYPAGVAHLA